jgi:ADP-ribose pyrophosphatase YjhB (NUDIX family)
MAGDEWLRWARELQALSQIGISTHSEGYDLENYRRVGEIAAEMVAHQTDLPTVDVKECFRVQPGYATAKVDVRGAVVRDGALLLVRERSDGRWAMPGGWADVGDLPSAMVAREVREESGFVVRPTRVVGVFDANRSPRAMEFFHAYKVVFLCDLVAGEPTPSDETSDVAFFPPDDLPPLSRFRTDDRHVSEVFAHVADPTRPAAFD